MFEHVLYVYKFSILQYLEKLTSTLILSTNRRNTFFILLTSTLSRKRVQIHLYLPTNYVRYCFNPYSKVRLLQRYDYLTIIIERRISS